MSAPRVMYVGHPFDAPTAAGVAANYALARRWVAWLQAAHPEWSVVALWLRFLDVMEDTAANHERAVRDNIEVLLRCDGLVLVGGRLSVGMATELSEAHAASLEIVDLLHLGDEPPTAVG